jgi:hypothetical protein
MTLDGNLRENADRLSKIHECIKDLDPCPLSSFTPFTSSPCHAELLNSPFSILNLAHPATFLARIHKVKPLTCLTG